MPVELTGPQPDILDYDEIEAAEPGAPEGAPLRERIIKKIRQETLSMASVAGTITASCRGGSVPSDCTTTYNGVAVHWSVVESLLSTSLATEYELWPDKELLTSKIIYHNVYVYLHQTPDDAVRCQEVPDVVLVEKPREYSTESIDTGIRCQFLGVARDGQRIWTEMRLFMDNSGMTWARAG